MALPILPSIVALEYSWSGARSHTSAPSVGGQYRQSLCIRHCGPTFHCLEFLSSDPVDGRKQNGAKRLTAGKFRYSVPIR
jgi:hypothetical protein